METLLETKLKTASLKVNKEDHTATLTLKMIDLIKLEEMLENISELSMGSLHDHHWRIHSLITNEIKRSPGFANDYLRLLEDLNKMLLTIAENGDFATELHRNMSKVTREI